MSKRHVAVGIAAVVTLALTGCGNGGTSGTTGASAASSSSATGSTAGFPGVASLKVGDTVDAKAFSAAGAAAMKAAGTVKMTMESAAAGGTLSGEADFTSTPPALSFSGKAQGQEISVVVVDGLMYVKVPELGNKSWLKIDPNGTDEMSKALGGLLKPITAQADPSRLLSSLPQTTATVVAVGNGTATLEQKITSSEMSQFIKLMYGTDLPSQTTLPSAATVRTTVDEKARPLKVVVSTGGSDQTLRYSDWGGDVTITAPPADQIGTFQMPGSGMPSPSSSG